MIYFFHHYELPAILQQIRIQEMLLQNQQAAQGNQTALQDNLNNNTTTNAAVPNADRANAAGSATANSQEHQPAPGLLQHEAPSGVSPGAAASTDQDWMAETAAIITEAIITEALSNPLLESSTGIGVAMGTHNSDIAAGDGQGRVVRPPVGDENTGERSTTLLTDCTGSEVGLTDTRQWDAKQESESLSEAASAGVDSAPSWSSRGLQFRSI